MEDKSFKLSLYDTVNWRLLMASKVRVTIHGLAYCVYLGTSINHLTQLDQ